MWDLFAASTEGRVDELLRLIHAGADVNESTHAETPLMIASLHGNVECVRELIAAGANIEARTWSGSNALMLASCNGHLECARELLEAGATTEHCNDRGPTALMCALTLDMLQLLCSYGASRSRVTCSRGGVDSVLHSYW